MMQVLVKAPFCQSLLGTRAGLPARSRKWIQMGKDARRRMLIARRDAVVGDWMVVRSALRTLRDVRRLSCK